MHRTAAMLQARGHAVAWATEKRARPWLTRWNIPLISLPTTGWHQPPTSPVPVQDATARARRAVAVWLNPEHVVPATQALETCIQQWQPDWIVTEPFIAAAAFAAERTGTPLVVTGWPAVAFTGQTPPHQKVAARLAQEWFLTICDALNCKGIFWTTEKRPWIRSPWLHLVYFTPTWYGSWRVLVPPTAFVGGIPAEPQEPAPQWLPSLADKGMPVVFITLGTLFVEDEAFFHQTVTAARAEGCAVVVATGRKALAARLRARLPADVVVTPWVDYAHLFPHVRAVIHHGGVGTTHAALVYGIPQLVVPHAGDQHYQAARVQRTGVGLALLPRDVRVPVLRDALRSLLWDAHWRHHATRMAQAMHRLGGVPRAVELLASLTPSDRQ